MDELSFLSSADTETIEEIYRQYKQDPDSIDLGWRRFFQGFEFSGKLMPQADMKPDEFKVIDLINEYRKRGHLFTKTNPVRTRRTYSPTLHIDNFGLTESDREQVFKAGGEIGIGDATLNAPKNSFLPHNYAPNVVVYTGTHDNDTTIGWFKSATERERSFVKKYTGTDGKEIHWDLIRLASQSVADMAIYPMQDVLGLGTEARMNLPGKSSGYWEWRFSWEQVAPGHATRLYELTALFKRCSPDRLELPAFPHGNKLP